MESERTKPTETKTHAKYPFLFIICSISFGFTLIEIVFLIFSSALPIFLCIITIPLLLIVLIISIVMTCIKRMHWIVPLLIAILFLTWLYVLIASVICTIGLHAERGLAYPGWSTEHIYNFHFIYVQEIDNVYDEYGTFLSYWSVTRVYPCVNIIYNIGLFVTILTLYIRERKGIKTKKERKAK